MIKLEQVCKIFNKGKANQFSALKDVSCSINGRSMTVLHGPSGSGKSTLLSLIGCLARPSSGQICLDGDDISHYPERFLTELRRKTFGFVFQNFQLIQGMSTLENVTLAGYPTGNSHGRLRQTALALLDRLGMAPKAGLPANLLSGGEAQRVAIARALINDPQVVIADEPTANLDGRLVDDLLENLRRLREEGRTLLISSHDPRIISSELVDARICLRDGSLAETDFEQNVADNGGLTQSPPRS